MKKEVSLVKEKRTICKCAIGGEDCYYVVFTNTYKETSSNIFGVEKERAYDVTEKSMLRFETKEKAEQYSKMVAKCDTMGSVECGEATYDTYTVPVILIYPKHYEVLEEYGSFGCIKDDINKKNRYGNLDGFTFFPYLTTNKLYCNVRNSGCLAWSEFVKIEDVVKHYIKVLKLNIDFPEDEVVSFEILHISKNKLAALQASDKRIAEVRQAICDMEEVYQRYERATNALNEIPDTMPEKPSGL